MRAGLLAALAAFAVAGVAAAATGEPQKRLRPADQAYARSVLLTKADLGSGWKGSQPKGGGSPLHCKGFAPDQSDLVETGKAAGLEFVRADGAFVTSTTSVFQSKAGAQASWNRVVRPGLVKCLAGIIEKGTTSTVTIKTLASGPIGIPKLAPRTAAYRLVIGFTVKQNTGKVTVRGHLDVVLLGRGRTDVVLLMLSALKPLAPQLELKLAKTIADRLEQ